MSQYDKEALVFSSLIGLFIIIMVLIFFNAMENKKLLELQLECQKAEHLWNNYHETCMIGPIPPNFPYGER